MFRKLSFSICVFFAFSTQQAYATLLTYELTDSDTLFSATFVFEEDDSAMDGIIYSSDLASITADILGTGLFTYSFAATASTNCGSYDVSDLSLISWTCGGNISSTNANALGQTLNYAHSWFDESTFTLGGITLVADWNGSGIEVDGLTDLNVSNSTAVPEPSVLALIGLGLAGIGFSRRRKQLG